MLGLSWLDRYNLDIDWNTRKLTFQSDSSDLPSSIDTYIPQNPKNIGSHLVRASKTQIPLFIGAKAFMRATKKGTTFAIYATPASEQIQASNQLPV